MLISKKESVMATIYDKCLNHSKLYFMLTTQIQYQELDASEASFISGGAPTTETSLAYDIGWLIGYSLLFWRYQFFYI